MKVSEKRMNIDILDNPTKDYFHKNYESQNIPCLIRNFSLDWPIFKMPDYYIAKKIKHRKFLSVFKKRL